MEKTSQKRSILNQLREKINIPGSMIEGFFKPELDRIMNDLRMADDNIRTILTGQKIGNADVEPGSGRPIKDLLKSARSNFNRREYMAGVADLGEFHKKLFDVTKFIDTLDLSINKIHHNFLFQNLSDEQKQNIKGLQEYMSTATEIKSEPYFIKEAGIMDFFYNIGTKRGRALAIWEKKYPKVVKDLRDGGMKLLDTAESVLSNVLSLLKAMATARAVRKVDTYMDAAKKIRQEYTKFDSGDKGFRAYYANIILPYIKNQEEYERKESEKNQEPNIPIPLTQVKSNPVSEAPPTDPAPPPSPPGPPIGVPPGVMSSPPSPPLPNAIEEQAPDTEKRLRVASAHQRFYKSLESMSNEDPRILANVISKYAATIQHSDPMTAIELFGIARKIKG